MNRKVEEKELGNIWGIILPWYGLLALLLYCLSFHPDDIDECVSILIRFISLTVTP
jgi:hypothetical protein